MQNFANGMSCEKTKNDGQTNRQTKMLSIMKLINDKPEDGEAILGKKLRTIKATLQFKQNINRVENEIVNIRKNIELEKKSIEEIDQKITEQNIQAINEDDIKSILEGTAKQVVTISAEALYGHPGLSAVISNSPCDWLKVPESDALVIRPDDDKKSYVKNIFVEGESENPKKKCVDTKCWSPFISPDKIQIGLETMYAGMLGNLGLRPGGRTQTKIFLQQLCNNELQHDGGAHVVHEEYKEIVGKYGTMGGCDDFCDRFASKIEPLLATKYKSLYEARARRVAVHENLLKDEKKAESTRDECRTNEEDDIKDVEKKKKLLRDYVDKKTKELDIIKKKNQLEEEKTNFEKNNEELYKDLQDIVTQIPEIMKQEMENEKTKRETIEIIELIKENRQKIKKIDEIVTKTTDKVEKLVGLGGILDDIYRTAGEAAQEMTKAFREKMSNIQLWLKETPVTVPDMTQYPETNVCDQNTIELLQMCPWWIGDEDMTSHILVSPLQAAMLAKKKKPQQTLRH